MTYKLNDYTREALAVLQKGFHNLRIWKRDREPTGKFDFEGQEDLIIELPQDWGYRLLEGTNKTLCTPGSGRKKQSLCKRWSQTCLGVSGAGLRPQWPDLGQRYWLQKSWEVMASWYKSFWKRSTADTCLHGRHSDTQRQVCVGLLRGPGFPVLRYSCPLSQ